MHKDKEVICNIALDSCSTTSFIREKIAAVLELPCVPLQLNLAHLGGVPTRHNAATTTVLVESLGGDFREEVSATILPAICGEVDFHDTNQELSGHIDVLLDASYAFR